MRARLCAICLAAVASLAPAAGALQNQLLDHPSPYLAMHGLDPVAWQDWDRAAVERARAEDKLLLVSSGYFACHWCHVMQRESYRDADIARFLNEHFVPVKLDRELHPALDAHLIDFLDRTQGQSGWPLNIFLTPEGYPLIGATYLPPRRFAELLQRLQRTWANDRAHLRNLARRTMLQLMRVEQRAEVPVLDTTGLNEALLRQALSIADIMEGGFGQQSRFPMAPQLAALLDLQGRAPHAELAEFLQLTLDAIADRGLRDHLAGGFFRYTVDPSWEIPHFEKMLYTQALLAEVFIRAADLFGRDDYAAVALDTLRFAAAEMCRPQAGCVASFSAVDGDGEEGGVYLWSVDELRALLGEPDAALARRYWRMQGVPAFGGRHLPQRGEPIAEIAAALDLEQDSVAARLDRARGGLLAARRERELPVDDKLLAGWNGLMLAALSRGAQRWQDPQLRATADGIATLLRERLWDGARLRRALAAAGEVGRASLADYAYVAYGMTHYAVMTGSAADRAFVAALLREAWQRFHTEAGWRLDDAPLIPGLGSRPALRDGALPAPSGVVIRLSLVSADAELRRRAAAAAQQARPDAQGDPFWFAGHYAVLTRQP